MADWNKIWERRQRSKNFHNTGRHATIRGSGFNSAAFVKSVIKRRKKNKVARKSRKANR